MGRRGDQAVSRRDWPGLLLEYDENHGDKGHGGGELLAPDASDSKSAPARSISVHLRGPRVSVVSSPESHHHPKATFGGGEMRITRRQGGRSFYGGGGGGQG
jgi:hypothetical protein